MWNPFTALGNLFAGVHFEWKEDENHEWVHKSKLIYGIIIISVLVAGTIGYIRLDTQQKAGNVTKFSTDVQAEMCSTFGGEADRIAQEAWQKFAQDAKAPMLPMPALNFTDAHAYYLTQCGAAQSYVVSVGQATTEEQKAQLYKDIAAFRTAVANHTAQLRDQQFVLAQGCLSSYQAVHMKESMVGQTHTYASDAFVYLQSGRWEFCSFYALQGMDALEVFVPTNTPTPLPTTTPLPGTPGEPFWSSWSQPEPTLTPISLFQTPSP